MKQVLMCKPLHFQVDYEINPWMKIGSVNQKKAMREWEDLVSVYRKLGIEVEVIDQQRGVPDMVFAADQGIVNGNHVLLSNFTFRQRRNETKLYEKWYTQFGLTIHRLPKDIHFEGGGETVRWRDVLFIGTGFRTDKRAVKIIERTFERSVIGLELIDKRFYHLDTCLFVLDEKTAFFFPPAFSHESIDVLKNNIPHLLELHKEDVLTFAANSVVVDESVVMQKGSTRFSNEIRSLGYTPITVDVGEFIKAGGGVHCLTGELG